MPKEKIKLNNKIQISFFLGGLFAFFILTIVMPLIFIKYLSFSGIGHFFLENTIYIIFSGIILFYFSIVGAYYYDIKIDPYVIQITSFRPIAEIFQEKNFVDVPHIMLVDYAFFNRPLSFNKTLMLKIETDKKKKIIKRFNLTLISKKKIRKISRILDRIIAKNN
ncbi:MAG: hypothetical protein VX762_06060 [Bacteroidota bacterium]|nr:hypothetical protein [Bacteroidota bacterium]